MKDEAIAFDLALNALLWANNEINDWRHDAHGYTPEDQPQIMEAITAIKQALAAPVQEPVASLKEVDVLMMAETHGIDPSTKCLYGFYTDCISNQPASQPAPVPDFKAFKEWAANDGYDVAYAHDGIKWACLNPMTADLWKAWQAATPPAAQRQWVGLTDEERNKLWRDVVKWGDPSHDDVDLIKAIEAKLKELNT
jgi:hypothetical protein